MSTTRFVRPVRSIAGISLTLALLSACSVANVHIFGKDTPPPPPVPLVSPSATANGDRFELAVVVVNPTKKSFPANWFSVKVEAFYSTGEENNCKSDRFVEVYQPLGPGDAFELDHVRFDLPNQPAHPCQCFKNDCHGLMFVTLVKTQDKQRVSGDQTKYLVQWSGSGSPSDGQSQEMN